ncbi:putative major sperm protein (MSP) [Helianthus annuus]|nr:putative major sperm protein (MSP) [Helianthus annuus]
MHGGSNEIQKTNTAFIQKKKKKKHYYIPEQKINDQSCFGKSLFTGRTDHFDISADLVFCFAPVELKKQSSCSVQMINKTNHHVAFKIKTTNPKKYCVRPNAGVIDPNASCEFSVTMQAPKVAPPDMISKDKFLIQSTVVPEGTEEEDVTSNMVAESLEVPSESLEVTRKIEEPVKPKMEESSKRKDAARKIEEHVKPEMEESSKRKDAARKIEEPVKPKMEESSKRKDAERKIEEPSQVYAKRNEEFVQIDNTEELKLAEDVEAIRSKVKELESKLTEVSYVIYQFGLGYAMWDYFLACFDEHKSSG